MGSTALVSPAISQILVHWYAIRSELHYQINHNVLDGGLTTPYIGEVDAALSALSEAIINSDDILTFYRGRWPLLVGAVQLHRLHQLLRPQTESMRALARSFRIQSYGSIANTAEQLAILLPFLLDSAKAVSPLEISSGPKPDLQEFLGPVSTCLGLLIAQFDEKVNTVPEFGAKAFEIGAKLVELSDVLAIFERFIALRSLMSIVTISLAEALFELHETRPTAP
jgi:hypothetical protein